MRMKALGEKAAASAASASPLANGKLRLSSRPPPAAIPDCPHPRRHSGLQHPAPGEAVRGWRSISSGGKGSEAIEDHRQPPCPFDCAACLIASRMRTYVPQRQMLPDIASSMSASVGCGLLARSAEADMICPDWQQPHWTTPRSSQAFWYLGPAGVLPIDS